MSLGVCARGDDRFAGNEEWRSYGGDPGGMRYSRLEQINRKNVGNLQRAWTYHTGESNLVARHGSNTGFAATPLVVDGILYVTTHSSRLIALNAETGAEVWKYDPQSDRRKEDRKFQPNRGASYWEGPSTNGPGIERRIFLGTGDGRLIASDPKTGNLLRVRNGRRRGPTRGSCRQMARRFLRTHLASSHL
jgi:glucose dehydrogenase